MDNSMVLGVDIGGSHITAALLNLETKTFMQGSLVREYVNAKEAASQIIDAWNRVICKSFSAYPVQQKVIGIAMPGPFDYETGISLMKGQDKFDALYGLNIKDTLASLLDVAPTNIHFKNDAECFLLGEAFSGAAANFNKAVGLTLGTGLGSSIYENGVSKDADLWCSTFKDGIAEDYLSTRWFTQRYYLLTGEKVKDVKELADLAIYHPIAREVFNEFGKNLALFLEGFIQKNKPEVVVIGGNISNAFDLFEDSMRQITLPLYGETIIRRAILGEEAPLIGAASCWHKKEIKILAA